MFHDMNFCEVVAHVVRRVFAALILVTSPALAAQDEPSDLKRVAKEVAKDIAKANLSSVAVADFVAQNGEKSIEGHYLAQEFSWSLEQSNKRLTVTEPASVAAALSSAQLSPEDLTAADQFPRISSALHVDSIVSGMIEILKDRYLVHIAVRNTKDGSVLVSRDQKVKRPAYVPYVPRSNWEGRAGCQNWR